MLNQSEQAASQDSAPDYVGLVKFLLEPFLEESESLQIHCESLSSTGKVWLRVAFDTDDKGKVFGRGGRNIQAVGTILKTAAKNANQSLHLDVYNSDREAFDTVSNQSRNRREEKTNPPPRRNNRPRPPEKK